MLSRTIALECLRLLAEGKHFRQIAVVLHISRASVGNIKRWPTKYLQQPEPLTPATDERPRVRCAGCGHLVALPCIACRDRATLAAAKRPPGNEATDRDALHLALHAHEGKIYEKVRETHREPDEDQTADGWQEPALDHRDAAA
jgi:hypothetical protein